MVKLQVAGALLVTGLLLSIAAVAAEVRVLALFDGAALLEINGEQGLLRAGHAKGGVKLLAADTSGAEIEMDGQRLQLALDQSISGVYNEREVVEVQLVPDERRHYFATVMINDRPLRALIDTGATTVALSALHAARLGIDFRAGTPATVRTASGVADAWSITLDKVALDSIAFHNIEATVIEGAYPDEVLLGATFLRHVKIREELGILYLRPRY